MRWCSSPAKLASQRVRPDELYVMPLGRREVRCEDDNPSQFLVQRRRDHEIYLRLVV
jgi:hypothetical protein